MSILATLQGAVQVILESFTILTPLIIAILGLIAAIITAGVWNRHSGSRAEKAINATVGPVNGAGTLQDQFGAMRAEFTAFGCLIMDRMDSATEQLTGVQREIGAMEERRKSSAKDLTKRMDASHLRQDSMAAQLKKLTDTKGES